MSPLRAGHLVAAIAACVAVTGGAQPDPRQALVSMTVRPDTVGIGEPFTVRVRVRAPKVATIRFAEVPAPADGVDPLDPRAIEDGPTGAFLDRTAVYTFVAWDVGTRGPSLDPVAIVVGGREQRFALPAPTVVVRSLLPADTTQQTPIDARAPVKVPGKFWQYALVAIVLLAALALFVRARRRRARASRGRRVPEAWVQASEAFTMLDGLQLAESGELGRHVIAHVDVLRTYLERRFPTIVATLAAAAVPDALTRIDFPVPVHRVAALLERDAELRFAQAVLTADEAHVLATEARNIVADIQVAHEARLRAVERPPRPRRR